MAKIKIEDIRQEALEHGWELKTSTYKNLNTEMEWTCPEGHIVYSSYKKIRDKFICPTCAQDLIQDSTIEIKPKKTVVKRTLALDQATQLAGWSIFDDTELVAYGKIHLTQIDAIERISQLRQWLINMLINWNPDLVAIEDIQLQSFSINGKQKESVTTYKVLAQLQGALLVTLFEKNTPYLVAHVSSWRSHCHITAKKRSDQKRAAQLLVKEKYDKDVTQDEADAICIGLYAAEHQTKGSQIIDFSTL